MTTNGSPIRIRMYIPQYVVVVVDVYTKKMQVFDNIN